MPQDSQNMLNWKASVVIGVSNRVEIWAEDTWKDYMEQSESTFTEITENMMEFDF